MPTSETTLSYRIVPAMRTSGRNGYPSVWHVYEIHARYSVDKPPVALTRKDGNPRTFKSRQGARAVIRRLRAAE